MAAELRGLPGHTQEGDNAMGRGVVIERESAAVGNFIGFGVDSGFGINAVYLVRGLFETGIRFAATGGQPHKEGFGAEVVALFHHWQQHLVYGVADRGQLSCFSGLVAISEVALMRDAGASEGVEP